MHHLLTILVTACATFITTWSATAVAIEVPPVMPPWQMPPIQPPKVVLPPNEQPIALQRLDISAEVRGVLAEVTTTMVLLNPNPRQLSGELEFPLPDGAAVGGYALDVNGRMVDGVIVAQDKARVVLETESRRRVDPGIVEHVRGNAFRTRIFPLPPGGTRTVKVVWTAPLAVRGDEAALRLPLPRTAIPQLKLTVEISAPGVEPQLGGFGDLRLTRWVHGQRAETTLQDVTPGDDLLVRLPNLPAVLSQIEERNGERFVSISAKSGDYGKAAIRRPQRVAVAWDASGSITPAGAERGRKLLAALFEAAPGITIDLVSFDLATRPAIAFTDAGTLDAHLAALPHDGASNLAGLDLRRAALPNPADEAWLLISDGLGTWGEGLPASGDVPVFCAMPEPNHDEALLRLVAARSGGQVADLMTTAPFAALSGIMGAGNPFQRVDAAPGIIDEVQTATRGERTLILARLRGDGQATLRWRMGDGRNIDLRASTAVPGSVVARAWAGAKAAELAVFPEANRTALLALGRAYGVVTAGTSLLVLESLDQYLRHRVEPPATWPELQTQYLAQLKGRQQQRDQRWNGHQERLVQWWTERVRWWERKHDPVKMAKGGARAGWLGDDAATMRRSEIAPENGGAPPQSPATPPAALAAQVGDQAASRPAASGREGEASDADRSASPAFSAIGAGAGGEGKFASITAGGRRRHQENSKDNGIGDPAQPAQASIAITAWNPSTPWLTALRAAGPGKAYDAWLAQRPSLITTPAAVLDCAGLVLTQDRRLGLRVLSNLAELKLDDPGLLRVLAWRLQDADELDGAIAVLRKVLRLRPEEPQSYRDLAVALAARFDATKAAADASEALELLTRVIKRQPLEDRDLGERWTIDGNWDRFPQCEIIALEEFNRLAARSTGAPGVRVPDLDSRLRANLDCDLRIVMGWDADATDIDLHVLQPDGEEAFYGRNRTACGGLVSADCTQGYGPEEYLLRRAGAGNYQIKARFFGSRQTGLLGPATVSATVILDWGRPTERSQRLTLRLDRQGENIPIGVATVGAAANAGVNPGVRPALARESLKNLRVGMKRAEVEQALGAPERIDSDGVSVLVYRLSNDTSIRIGLAPDLIWVREVANGSERDLLR